MIDSIDLAVVLPKLSETGDRLKGHLSPVGCLSYRQNPILILFGQFFG